MHIIYLLATANAVLLFLTALILIKKNDAAATDSELTDFQVSNSRHAEYLARLDDLAGQLDALKRELMRLSLADRQNARITSGRKNYAAAGQLADSGCSLTEIMKTCDIPEAEARMVQRFRSAKETLAVVDTH